MITSAYTCPNCKTTLDPELFAEDAPASCPHCHTSQRQLMFPRLWRPVLETPEPVPVQSDTEAHCAFHEENRAEAPCDRCGRYICAVCTAPLDGKTYCPGCLTQLLEAWSQEKDTAPYKKEQLRYDLVVQYLAVLPIFTFWLPIITGPIAFVLGLIWLPRVRRTPECKLSSLLIGMFFAGLVLLMVFGAVGSTFLVFMEEF